MSLDDQLTSEPIGTVEHIDIDGLFAPEPEPTVDRERIPWQPPAEVAEQVQALVNTLKDLITHDDQASASVAGIKMTRDVAETQAGMQHVHRLLQRFAGELEIDSTTPQVVIEWVVTRTYDEFAGLGVLGGPWRDDDVTEICVDAWDRIVIEVAGKLQQTNLRFNSLEHAQDTARRMGRLKSDRALSFANPIVSAELPMARVQLMYGSAIVADEISITLRKFRELLNMDGLLAHNSLTEDMATFLHQAVRARQTILVSGGTGTGKTTVINALSAAIPPTERVISIEDALELQLETPNIVRLQSKTKSSNDDDVVISQGRLLVETLRMRPDRIILGEVREQEAAVLFMEAVNTGHDGALTSVHANSADLALNVRMINLIRTARPNTPVEVAASELASTLDFVVHVRRGANGARYIEEISYVPSTLKDNAIQTQKVYSATMVDDEVVFTDHSKERLDTA